MFRVRRRTTGPSARPIETRDPDKQERLLAETVKVIVYDCVLLTA